MIVQGNLEGASTKVDFMLNHYGQRPEICVLQGLLASHVGDLKGSLSAFSNALDLDASHGDAKHFLDLVYKQISPK